MHNLPNVNIAILGLGYVGLPLAVEFAKKYRVIGYDINAKRIEEVRNGYDKTLEVDEKDLRAILCTDDCIVNNKDNNGNARGMICTTDETYLAKCNVLIVTVPTPTDHLHRPVLIPLKEASKTIGRYLNKGDIVIYESTVYPGATEDECVPVLEQFSGLKLNKDFYVGYSPERINPGDREHTVTKILKITSGSTPETAEIVDQLYRSIIPAGTYRAPSIKIAEAAKVIENAQRDINIAFVNELAKIFNRLEIDTQEVLKAAGTKWNFLPFRPGLVGGHCIGVDPYYLAQKAQEVGYHPEIILAGRRINDGMGAYIAQQVVKCMIKKDMKIAGGRALVLGITFKENCPDIRNTGVIAVYRELVSYGMHVDIYDPLANAEDVRKEYSLDILSELNGTMYDAVVLAVSHNQFKTMNLSNVCNGRSVVFDVKGIWENGMVEMRL